MPGTEQKQNRITHLKFSSFVRCLAPRKKPQIKDAMRLGKKGEEAAAYYFSTRGFELMDKNYRCPIGELDLVVRDGNTVVFVEVKTRSSLAYGLPCESITQTKKNRIRKIVEYYAMVKRLEGKDLRIDVLEILIIKGTYYINHIENAF